MSKISEVFREKIKNKNFEDKDYRMALEIFLTLNSVALRHDVVMQEVPEGTAKETFLELIDDKTENGKVVAEGLVSRYKREYTEHNRKEGVWDIRYFSNFIRYIFDSITKNEELQDQFIHSFNSNEWKINAIYALGAKMVQELYEKGEMESLLAKELVDIAFLVDKAVYEYFDDEKNKETISRLIDLSDEELDSKQNNDDERKKSILEKIYRNNGEVFEEIERNMSYDYKKHIKNIPEETQTEMLVEYILAKELESAIESDIEQILNTYVFEEMKIK